MDLGLEFKVRFRACPITILNLLFAKLEMGAKWQGDEVSSILNVHLFFFHHFNTTGYLERAIQQHVSR